MIIWDKIHYSYIRDIAIHESNNDVLLELVNSKDIIVRLLAATNEYLTDDSKIIIARNSCYVVRYHLLGHKNLPEKVIDILYFDENLEVAMKAKGWRADVCFKRISK